MPRKIFLVLGILAVFSSSAHSMDYASNLHIEQIGNYRLVTVDQAYYGSSEPYRAALVPKGEKTEVLPGVPSIEVPLERLIVGSTPAVACLQALDSMEKVVGLAGGEYLYFEEGKTPEIPEVAGKGTMARALDREAIISLAPDGFLTYLYGDQEKKDAGFLRSQGIPVIFMAEYLEDSALGRAEWIKLVGILVGKEKEAADLFSKIASDYKALEALGTKAYDRPRVVLGAPFGGVWHVPRGDSWPVKMIEGAGGRYLFDDIKGSGAVPLDIERVVQRAREADFWLECGSWKSKSDAEKSGLPVRAFPAFLKGKIYNNDKRLNSRGGNDYYQSGVIRPDLILSDVIKILHPSFLPDYETVYFRKLP